MTFPSAWRAGLTLVLKITLVLGIVILAGCNAEAQDMADAPFPQRIKMQPFPEGLHWINTAAPIQLNDLRGKLVLLDFWTYCCINCMHVLPELKKLEEAYPDQLVVIGVHSAKFDEEKDTQNIRDAVLRYNITHPVVNDAEMVLWRRLGVRSWPSLVLVDPQGYAVWGNSGEATFEQLDDVMKRALPFYKKQGLLDEKPLRFELEKGKAEKTPLRFPGKVLADEPGDRLFIADSNHNRIVITQLDGTLLKIIGQTTIGRADGDYASAQFQQPQGMALFDETLYIADTENHLLRKVDLSNEKVTTIAGTGRQSRTAPPLRRMTRPSKTALNSPWALWVHEDYLYIAMAGPHQIWRMRLDESGIAVYAGSGREDIVDGPLAPKQAYQTGYSSFAQPSGLASDGTWLFVADSEGSSIRAVPFDSKQEVRTIVGTAHLPMARLFTFGDIDGRGQKVRLQHPLGVVYYRERLYVADTYNNKIKVIDPTDGTTKTLIATSQFDEPAGITAAAGKLFVADTNNHRIQIIDLDQQNKVSTLRIPNLQPPETPKRNPN